MQKYDGESFVVDDEIFKIYCNIPTQQNENISVNENFFRKVFKLPNFDIGD